MSITDPMQMRGVIVAGSLVPARVRGVIVAGEVQAARLRFTPDSDDTFTDTYQETY